MKNDPIHCTNDYATGCQAKCRNSRNTCHFHWVLKSISNAFPDCASIELSIQTATVKSRRCRIIKTCTRDFVVQLHQRDMGYR
eukprot:XP_001708313.1 Hypothetical protein GL50803_25051 [Giardia lamblia ATCC 50803]